MNLRKNGLFDEIYECLNFQGLVLNREWKKYNINNKVSISNWILSHKQCNMYLKVFYVEIYRTGDAKSLSKPYPHFMCVFEAIFI